MNPKNISLDFEVDAAVESSADEDLSVYMERWVEAQEGEDDETFQPELPITSRCRVKPRV